LIFASKIKINKINLDSCIYIFMKFVELKLTSHRDSAVVPPATAVSEPLGENSEF